MIILFFEKLYKKIYIIPEASFHNIYSVVSLVDNFANNGLFEFIFIWRLHNHIHGNVADKKSYLNPFFLLYPIFYSYDELSYEVYLHR